MDCDPPICASLCSSDDKCIPPHPTIGWDGIPWTFCLGWPQDAILLMSTSCVQLTLQASASSGNISDSFSKSPRKTGTSVITFVSA
jgi:hypothetical protein